MNITISDVVMFAVALAFAFFLSWIDKKAGGLKFPFFFINRPSMRTRFYLQERKKRRHQKRNSK